MAGDWEAATLFGVVSVLFAHLVSKQKEEHEKPVIESKLAAKAADRIKQLELKLASPCYGYNIGEAFEWKSELISLKDSPVYRRMLNAPIMVFAHAKSDSIPCISKITPDIAGLIAEFAYGPR